MGPDCPPHGFHIPRRQCPHDILVLLEKNGSLGLVFQMFDPITVHLLPKMVHHLNQAVIVCCLIDQPVKLLIGLP